MMTERMPTFFAPAERADRDTILQQARAFMETHCDKLMHAVPIMILVVNGQRQAIFANTTCLDLFGLKPEDALGMRPGDLFGCVHSRETEGGCGTTEYCTNCGAVRAMLAGLAGTRAHQQCRMLRQDAGHTEALELDVTVDPYELEGEQFAVLSIKDVSHEARRRVLERLFFHDVLNVVGGVRGLAEVLRGEAPESLGRISGILFESLDYLADEILSQKDLIAAENNELQPRPADLRALEFLLETGDAFAKGPAAKGVTVAVAPEARDFALRADPLLLRRVVGNMIKNAIEASRPGQTVLLGCRVEDGEGVFWVRNEAVMPREVRLQIFNRSFSTKGQGRGLGTYSILLITERYLRGRAEFSSRKGEGTMFRVVLPLA
ncbi:PAS domain-containing sensor histidine kinase [Desulfovibrio aminophilus]|nr:PAS domain-containing sensor histidine kinase [Desulfovibrio aminophilus]MCM0755888.1 PAS domain-containing sensor histidine kinase [Desulfovibrio aminophilus]